jgi:hypothetical protein
LTSSQIPVFGGKEVTNYLVLFCGRDTSQFTHERPHNFLQQSSRQFQRHHPRR